MKYLILGLGNIGHEYINTRHNIGFKVLDAFAEASNTSFIERRYGNLATLKHRARTLLLLKPNTYMNLSGNALNYWMQEEKIPIERVLVVVDDLALPFASLRLREKGSDAGHNGLKHIAQILGHQQYTRLRFGIGGDFKPGQQVDYVLGQWSPEEKQALPERIELAIDIIKSFVTIGTARTMNAFNGK